MNPFFEEFFKDFFETLPPLNTLGRYEIQISASVRTADGTLIPLEQKKNVDVATLPWLDVSAPVAQSRNSARSSAMVRAAGTPLPLTSPIASTVSSPAR